MLVLLFLGVITINKVENKANVLSDQLRHDNDLVEQQTRNILKNNLKQNLSTQALFLNNRIKMIGRSVTSLEENPLFKKAINNLDLKNPQLPPETIALLRAIISFDELHDLTLVNDEGIEIIRFTANELAKSQTVGTRSQSPNDFVDESNSKWFKKTKQQEGITYSFFKDSSKSDEHFTTSLSVSTPVHRVLKDIINTHTHDFYLRLTIPLHELVLHERENQNNLKLTLLCNKLKEVAWSNYDHQNTDSHLLLTEDILDGELSLILAVDEKNFSSSLHALKQLHQKTITELDIFTNSAGNISHSLKIIPWFLLGFVILIIAISIFIGIRIANHLSKPIVELNNATSKITKGQLHDDIPIPDKFEELQELASSIDFMREHIRDHINNLNDQVKKRTQELSETNLKLKTEMQERIKKEQEAIQLSKSKSNFLAIMSHEIRTPMNGIVSMISEIIKHSDDPELNEYADIVKRSSQSLMKLLNEILDFSKIETGKLEIEYLPINIKQVIIDSFEAMKQIGDTKKLSMSIELDPNIPDILIGDSLRISQIVNNLLSNAIKFTSAGSISIKGYYDNSTQRFHLSVQDTGIGINKDKIDQVFAPFTQLDNSTSRLFGGTGLGMNIVHSIISIMGGEISVESTEGEGTCFTLNFVTVAPINQDSPLPDNTQHHTIEHLDILIAEDNLVNQRICKILLDKMGHSSMLANNGLECLERLSEKKYDLVLMDCQMPKMDGLEATSKIKKFSSTHINYNIPIIALTANATVKDRQKCKEAGMDYFVSKPIHRDKLAQSLSEALEAHIEKNLSS